MNKLTEALRDWIRKDSLSGGRYEHSLDNVDDFDYSEHVGESHLSCEDLGLNSSIFELTVENFLSQISKSSSYVQYCRKIIGKKFKDFTLDDCFKLDEIYGNKYGCSLFGCGSDETCNETIMEIDGKKYFLEYSRY